MQTELKWIQMHVIKAAVGKIQRFLRESVREQDFENEQAQICPLPPYVSLPFGYVAFHPPMLNRKDGFPEPIMEKIPWLVRNELGEALN